MAWQSKQCCSVLDQPTRAPQIPSHRHNCNFVACPYDGVTLPMTNLLPSFNMQGPIAQRPSVGDLSTPISPARVALSLLLLAVQALPKSAVLRFIRVNMLLKRLVADGQLRGDLLRAPLQTQQSKGFFPYPRLNGWGIATVLRTLCRELTGLFGSIAPRTSITIQFPANGGLVPIQWLGNLRLIVSSFHEGVNLISFSLAEVFVFHKQLRLPGQEALNAIHPQPPNLQLIKVALRA